MIVFGWMKVEAVKGVPVYCWHPLWVQEELLALERAIDTRLLREHLDLGVSVSAPEAGGPNGEHQQV